MLPKTVVKHSVYEISDTTSAMYTPGLNRITLFIPVIKKGNRAWKRACIVAWCHEYVHYLQDSFSTKDKNLLDYYLEEIQAYKVQAIVESLLLTPHVWESPEEGARASIRVMARELIQSGEKLNGT